MDLAPLYRGLGVRIDCAIRTVEHRRRIARRAAAEVLACELSNWRSHSNPQLARPALRRSQVDSKHWPATLHRSPARHSLQCPPGKLQQGTVRLPWARQTLAACAGQEVTRLRFPVATREQE
jgi:hypothetical protein